MSSFPQSGLSDLLAQTRECLSRRDFSQAIQILQRARNHEPDNSHLLLELGFLHALVFDFSAAERCFEEAIQLGSSRTESLMEAGHHWRNVQRFDAAKHCFERILEHTHVPILALIRLAEIYERQRDVDHAIEMLERALQMEPAHGGALLVRARIHRQLKELEPAEKLLRLALAKSRDDNDVLIAAWYELGNVLDQQKRYDEAMSAFLEAKKLQRMDTSPLLAAQHAKQKSMQQTAEMLTAKQIAQWRKFGEAQLQPPRKLAFLCGYPRSGTTLLEYVLDSHPDIIGADETDVLVNKIYGPLMRNGAGKTLLDILDSMSGRNLRQLRADYFNSMEICLGQPIGARLLIDKNPSFTSDIPVLLRLFPEMKFLIALRDPRDVCLSCFMQATPINPDTLCWLTLDGVVSNYASIMSFWLKIKPVLGAVALEVRYEDMVGNFELTARRALDFLGVAWDDKVLSFDQHARSRTVSSPTYAEVTQPIFKTGIGRWQNYRKYFEPHLSRLSPYLQAFQFE